MYPGGIRAGSSFSKVTGGRIHCEGWEVRFLDYENGSAEKEKREKTEKNAKAGGKGGRDRSFRGVWGVGWGGGCGKGGVVIQENRKTETVHERITEVGLRAFLLIESHPRRGELSSQRKNLGSSQELKREEGSEVTRIG